jgi:hypothetical protein
MAELGDPKYTWEGKGLDEVSAKELYLFITNDGDLYRRQYEPIIKSLTAKKARGVYDHKKAAVAFGYLAETGAKWYEHGGQPPYGRKESIPSYFPKKLRDAVAEELRDNFEVEHSYGNYDNMIPKKYQAKPAKKKTVKKHDTHPMMGGMR